MKKKCVIALIVKLTYDQKPETFFGLIFIKITHIQYKCIQFGRHFLINITNLAESICHVQGGLREHTGIQGQL